MQIHYISISCLFVHAQFKNITNSCFVLLHCTICYFNVDCSRYLVMLSKDHFASKELFSFLLGRQLRLNTMQTNVMVSTSNMTQMNVFNIRQSVLQGISEIINCPRVHLSACFVQCTYNLS